MQPQNPHKFILWLLICISIISIIISLKTGTLSISWSNLSKAFLNPENELNTKVILDIRLPRILIAFITGALLSLAGALMQVLLRNPLADPYILGISGGAATFSLIAMMYYIEYLHLAAFSGAIFSMFLVFSLSKNHWHYSERLLLTGVILAFGWGAMISFLLATSPDQQLRGLIFWLMGDLSYADNIGLPFLFLVVGLIISLYFARDMNILLLGQLQAASLGVSIKKLHYVLYFIASLLTASAVTQVGTIGFIGLVVPHILRLSGIHDYRVLLPACTLLGGSLLVLADTLARTLMAPQQLPVGAITALLGVPLFLYLLQKK